MNLTLNPEYQVENLKSVGEEFYQIINKDVLSEIARAAASLLSDLLYMHTEDAEKIITKSIDDAKAVVNCYLDGQKNLLIGLTKIS